MTDGSPPRNAKVRRLAVAAAALVALGSACSTSNLQFVNDGRLHFVTPKSQAMVHLPITITWEMSDFHVVAPGTVPASSRAGYYAVFVDRAPVKAGQTLAAVADSSCRRLRGCITAGYLADRGVYATTSASVTLTQIASLNSYQKVQLHEATVVLLDSAGRRIGESAWYRDFRVRTQQQ